MQVAGQHHNLAQDILSKFENFKEPRVKVRGQCHREQSYYTEQNTQLTSKCKNKNRTIC